MRRDCQWFSDRASITWRGISGRSFLLVVPHGNDETAVAKHVEDWTEKNFQTPSHYSNIKPVVVRLTSDGVKSSIQFVRKICRELEKHLGHFLTLPSGDDAAHILDTAIEETITSGLYPIIIIERFHAFVHIADDQLYSVLSSLRSQEHASQVTTIAISPISYSTMRRLMEPGSPFLNSAYGDNHDQAVMTPLSREDFVMAATASGLSTEYAHILYRLGGGPDAVYRALIDTAIEGSEPLTDHCLSRLGDILDRFFEQSVAEPGYDIKEVFARLALGCLRPKEEPFIEGLLLSKFISYRSKSGQLVMSSPILSRSILQKSQPEWRMYEDCLTALTSKKYDYAISLADIIEASSSRLNAFTDLVGLIVSLNASTEIGLLGIDWWNTNKFVKRLLQNDSLNENIRLWVETMNVWCELVRQNTSKKTNRLQLDSFTIIASDNSTRDMLLYVMSTYIEKVRNLPNSSQRVKAIANLPEAILQGLASSQCSINYLKAPEKFPELDYDLFFGSEEKFQLPTPGTKMDLTSLLVTVPTILESSTLTPLPSSLTNPNEIRPLQQKLVERLRNPNAHTFVNFSDKEADFLVGVCESWIVDWICISGYSGVKGIPGVLGAPSMEDLTNLLYGHEMEDKLYQ